MRSHYHPLAYSTDSSVYFAHIHHEPGAIWLDSGHPFSQAGRYDICSAWPVRQLQPEPGETVNSLLNRARQLLAELPAELPAEPVNKDLPFTGGLLGYLGYSSAISNSRHANLAIPAQIGLYPWALLTDHQQRCSGLVFHSSVPQHRQQALVELFSQPCPVDKSKAFQLNTAFAQHSQPEQYHAVFEQIQERIRQAECQQVNLAQCFSSHYRGDPWTAYLALRSGCPAPYAGFVRLGDEDAILSSSPERFIQIQQQQLYTYPIKGTRPRGNTAEEDSRLASELLASAKDRRENLLTVKLMLEELSACCQPDSLQTPELCQLHSFANVHHLISCVTGTLKPGLDALDALQQCFPAGSISGIPKQPAMQLIEQLETDSREIYCGSLFYLDNHGHFDSSVTIRSLLAHQGKLSCWGGGGITSGSNWQAEYQESIDKVERLMQILEQAFLHQ